MKKLYIVILISLSIGSINSQWQQVFYNEPPYLFGYGSNIFAGTGITGIYISTNNGSNWSQTSLINQTIHVINGNGSSFFAGTNSGVYASTNGGINWSLTSLTNIMDAIIFVGNNVLAGGTYGIYLSTNNGSNWTRTFNINYEVNCLLAAGGTIFAGMGPQHGVYKSTDNGLNWTQTSLNIRTPNSLAAIGNNIFAGMAVYGVYKSTDNGVTWAQSSFNNQTIYQLVVSGTNLIAGTSQGIYLSTDYGTTWTQRNEGFGGTPIIYSVCIYNNNLFAGGTVGGNHGGFRRPVSELVVITQVSIEVPNKFSLSQNYPNPFNPATNIEFAVPKPAFVKLVVYDITGRELETLVNENLAAGTYKADWNATAYSSGVYFYTITSGSYHQTRKMILVK